jgi:outer membrane lipoprotein-sorting protein
MTIPMSRRALLATALLAPAAARAETPLETLMRRLAEVRAGTVGFTEVKDIPEFFLPLESRGTMSWRAPDRLEKRTVWPIEEVLLVEGNRLSIERPDQGMRRELSLDQSPELRPLVEAIRGTLSGDVATLRRFHEVAFEGDARAWTLVLTPLAPRVRQAVQRITMTGREAQVLEIDTRSGASTAKMRIEPRR